MADGHSALRGSPDRRARRDGLKAEQTGVFSDPVSTPVCGPRLASARPHTRSVIKDKMREHQVRTYTAGCAARDLNPEPAD
jgi:hypothetical protein